MQDKESIKGFMGVPNTFEEAKEKVLGHIKKAKTKVTEIFTIEINKKYGGNVKLDYQNWDINCDEGRIHLWIHPNFRGKGLATKVLSKIIYYGFSKKKFKVIYAQCKRSNKAICKVNKKVGFKLVEERIVNGTKKLWWRLDKP
jgi:RimJ/RimL family protein N-acetyltransferase